MIKKISQLNRLPEEFYLNIEDSDDSAELIRKRDESLFEVSYETNGPINQTNADEVNYYTSYSTTLSGIGQMLEIDKIKEMLSTIIDGGLSVVSGDFIVGTKGNAKPDRLTGHEYYPDLSHDITIYSKMDFQNRMTVHGPSEFHNNVVLKCNDSGADSNLSSVLSVEGVATFDKVINGTAYRAKWGDLAEIYSADAKYEPGTLVKFGGEKEITIASEKANGVVTSNPAVVLNDEEGKAMEFPTGVALVGRVPVKVRGKVRKFDKIVLSHTDPGMGVVYNYAYPVDVIARALEDNQDPGEKLVMCATKMNLI